MFWLHGVKNEEAWYFSVMNVSGIVKEDTDRGKYWNWLKRRLKESGNGWPAKCFCLEMLAAFDGRNAHDRCCQYQTISYVIQPIFSERSCSFKQWLAKVIKQQSK